MEQQSETRWIDGARTARSDPREAEVADLDGVAWAAEQVRGLEITVEQRRVAAVQVRHASADLSRHPQRHPQR